MRIPEQYQLMLFWCCHCYLWAYFTPSLPVSVNFEQVTVSYDDHPSAFLACFML